MDEGQEAPRYFSTYGPEDGPLRRRDVPGALGVVVEPGAYWPIIGEAYAVTWREDERGAVAHFELRIHKVRVEGLWECVGRAFRRRSSPPSRP